MNFNLKVQYNPEPIEMLKLRYKDAIAIEWIVADGMADTPSQNKENVFDCMDGLRMTISLEQLPGYDQSMIHFQASVNPSVAGSAVWLKKKKKPLLKDVKKRFVEISGNNNKAELASVSSQGVLHFLTLPKIFIK